MLALSLAGTYSFFAWHRSKKRQGIVEAHRNVYEKCNNSMHIDKSAMKELGLTWADVEQMAK